MILIDYIIKFFGLAKVVTVSLFKFSFKRTKKLFKDHYFHFIYFSPLKNHMYKVVYECKECYTHKVIIVDETHFQTLKKNGFKLP